MKKSTRKHKVINAVNGIPPPSGAYSRAVRFGNVVYVSGLSPRTAEGKPFRGSIEEEVTNVLNNISRILEQAGSSLEKMLKVTVILNDSRDWEKMNTVYQKYFPESPPARTTFQSNLDGAKVEMDAVGYV